jgi:hypothetical protein
VFQVCIFNCRFRPQLEETSKKKLKKLSVNGDGSKFPKVDFNCLNGQFPITLKEIDIFERA